MRIDDYSKRLRKGQYKNLASALRTAGKVEGDANQKKARAAAQRKFKR